MTHPTTNDSDASDEVKRNLAPDVVMIGAAKSATTLLSDWLDRHPRISLGKRKEPNFFSHDEHYDRGWTWYLSQFAEVPADSLTLDASTGYTRWPQHPHAAARMHRHLPDAKLIYVMRHPVDRAYSHYVHRWSKECHRGEPFHVPFEEYVLRDPMCIDSSRYDEQMKRYLEYYSSDALLCLFTARIRSHRVDVLKKVMRFLQIEPTAEYFENLPRRKNRTEDYLESRVRVQLTDRVKSSPVGSLVYAFPKPIRELAYRVLRRSANGRQVQESYTPPPMRPETRRKLLKEFDATTRWVEQFTGVELPEWRQ